MSNNPIYQQIIEEKSQSYKFRQKLIREIQEITNRKLITYISNPDNPFANILRHDIPLFEDVLRTTNDTKVDFLINSPGGEPNSAEKILMACRQRFKRRV